MRFISILLIAIPCMCLAQGDSPTVVVDTKDSSYAIGYKLGAKIAAEMPLNIQSFLKGFTAGAKGKDSKLSDQETERAISELQAAVNENRLRASGPAAKLNIEEGDEYLEQNRVKKGIRVTASGLQYEVLKEGSGDYPDKYCIVTVRFEGRLVNGKVFDSVGWPNFTPTRIYLGDAIPGWIEGLQLMRPGAKYRFVIPPELAYGERGAGASVGPNATLVFDVELIEFEPFG